MLYFKQYPILYYLRFFQKGNTLQFNQNAIFLHEDRHEYVFNEDDSPESMKYIPLVRMHLF